MSAAFQELRRFNAHGAVVRGKGLIKLGHLAADGRRLVDQVNLEARVGKIKSGLNTADPTADDHNISEILFARTVSKPSLNWFFFHVSRSLWFHRFPKELPR